MMPAITCLSCAHSVRCDRGMLWCQLIQKEADMPCKYLEYEPGTDELETKESHD